MAFGYPMTNAGSGSDFVRSPGLTKFGSGESGLAFPLRWHANLTIARIRREARASLAYPPVVLNEEQIAAIGRGVTREIEQFAGARMHAFAQLPDHFHFVCTECRYDVRRFAGRLKGAGTRALLDAGIHPLGDYRDARGNIPSPWASKPWVVYLFDDEDMARSIKYVKDNLVRARMRPQEWSFVVPYSSRGS